MCSLNKKRLLCSWLNFIFSYFLLVETHICTENMLTKYYLYVHEYSWGYVYTIHDSLILVNTYQYLNKLKL